MNKSEARRLIRNELAYYQNKTYAELVSLINEEFLYERPDPSGAKYQIQILIMWDSSPHGIIRITGAIDDGGWIAFTPLTDSILIYPEDTT